MKDLKIRVISGFFYVALLLFSILKGPSYFFPVIFIFCGLATLEFFRLIKSSVVVPMLLLSALFYLFIQYRVPETSIRFLLLLSITSSLLFTYRLFKPLLVLSKSILYLLGIGYIVGSCFFIAALYGNTYFVVMLVYLLIWVNNSAAYFVGSQLGKTPLFPSISPKKSWEGFWGGQIFTLIAAAAIYLIHPDFIISPFFMITLGILIPTLATVGDLVQSQFKRIAGVKDSGRLLPGHGGFYDRMDSIIYTAPFVYLLLEINHYVS